MQKSLVEVEQDSQESEFQPLTAQQAQLWRKRHPVRSPWMVVAMQAGFAVLLVLAVVLVTGNKNWAWSVAYGAVSVVLPGAIFAHGLRSASMAAQVHLARFFVWELVKLVLTVVMLLLSPRLVDGLNWLALFGGFVVTMKVAWLAMLLPKLRTLL